MGLFTSIEFDSMETLLIEQLQDLYDAEQRLTKALPKVIEAAHDPKLKKLVQTHLQETEHQVTRLEKAFAALGQPAKSKTCEAMKGLLKEGEEVISATGNADVKDAALIAASQRIEHYEMAGYGSARNFARSIGKTEVARLLQETLDEEKNADHLLTELADTSVNTHAAHAKHS